MSEAQQAIVRAGQCMVLFCAASMLASGCAEWREKSPIKIASAKRAEKYKESPQSWLKPQNTERDVILVITFTGIPADEFQKVGADRVYVEANGKQYRPAMAASGRFPKPGSGSTPEFTDEQIILAVAVPRDVLEFKLHVGNVPVRTVKPEKKIEPELKMAGMS